MRVALFGLALTGSVLLAFAADARSLVAHHQHRLRLHRHAHIAPGYHIPRFDQGEAEAYVHTVYSYRTGLYVPWPDAYGAPYPY